MEDTTNPKDKPKPVIKHLVLSGGGPSGIQTLGALQHLEKNGYWNIENIESIYATSVGCILAILIALKFDWTTINDYVIKRPWHEVAHININQVFSIFSKKGFYDVSIIDIFFKPFFDSLDISLNITFKDFFELTKIDLHFFSLDVNSFIIDDFSYTSTPDLAILNCAYMSATIPLLFSPICIDRKCYIDGGLLTNYPLKHCIKNVGQDKKENILGFKNYYSEKDKETYLNSESNVLQFITLIISKLVENCQKCDSQIEIIIENEVICHCQPMSLNYLQETVKMQENRENLLKRGIEFGKIFIEQN
jgi:predicted patatin/cPLA2 family phospholipase